MDELAEKPERKAGIFAVQRGDEVPDVICQVNTTPLPGHPEPVLRVRLVTVCPAIDFGTFDMSRYIETLADLFFGIVELSQGDELAANEFKLHLRGSKEGRLSRQISDTKNRPNRRVFLRLQKKRPRTTEAPEPSRLVLGSRDSTGRLTIPNVRCSRECSHLPPGFALIDFPQDILGSPKSLGC